METVWSYGVWVLSFGVGCGDVVILLFVLKMIAYGEKFFFYHLFRYVSDRFIDLLQARDSLIMKIHSFAV